MRLLRVGPPGRERPCALAPDGSARDLSAWVDDWRGAVLDPDALAALAVRLARAWKELPVVDLAAGRIGPPVRPGQIVSIGLNYRRHAAQAGLPLPAEPIVSSKSVHALAGPFDPLVLPPGSAHTDWEVELGVVVGRRAQYLASPEAARAHIAGYCTANDISDRRWLLERGGEWIKGKSFSGFAPLGPYMVSADEVGDPARLRLSCRVNGVLMQSEETADMVFDVYTLVYYLSLCMVLEPGDVILTGSPSGMAYGRPGQPFLRPGDVVEAEVVPLGLQRRRCIAAVRDEGLCAGTHQSTRSFE
ncbi:fumarylacetoacetate hydrolase family protein [Massilia rhizosphaerae]|uniref:fumarylacetoacetate hydrolase family protein n=1 Tax=Massilia rhizosphaerae TaxID=2784389 RepID=UPI0018DB29CA|nr:fumarylacetoacetate hydrolase family protein [Massilia rhizosphaerae]